MRKLLLCCLVAAVTTPTRAQLTPSEQKLIAYVNSHMDAAIQLLITSVNINSGTLNAEGVKKVGALYAEQLRNIGFTIEWVNEPDSLHRAGETINLKQYPLLIQRAAILIARLGH
jgi:glutamate carboxypeptidase